jgi:hypothetical protein
MSRQALKASNDTASVLIDGDARIFRDSFDRVSFEFAHHLAGHQLFELPRLHSLAKDLPRNSVYFDTGNIAVNQRWDMTPRSQLSVDQLFDRIEHVGAWAVLKHVQQDPEYAALLDQCLLEIRNLVGTGFPRMVKICAAHVFVTSPNRISIYHMNRDCSFLLQIRGEKAVSVFNRDDREVLPEQEIERFWAGDHNAAIYKPQFQDRAHDYRMRPGTALHIPVNAPHCGKNADNVAVTLAVTFQYLDSQLANIYRTNYFLRKAGIRPLAPGRSRIRDTVKAWAMGSAIKTRRFVGRILREQHGERSGDGLNKGRKVEQ